MNIEQLQFFLAVAKTLHFSVAAEGLCISQSSLSKHIKSLEKELGTTLFERTTRNIKLTSAGKAFHLHAEKIVEEYVRMLASVKEFLPTGLRTLSIAAIPVLDCYGLTDMITSFSRRNSDIKVNIFEEDARYAIRELEDHKADIGILRTSYIKGFNFNIFPIIRDEMVLAAGINHPLAKYESVSLSQAEDETFFLLGENTCLLKTFVDECVKCGFYPRLAGSEFRLSTIKHFVAQGLGVTLLMKRVADRIADHYFKIIRLDEKPILTMAIITRSERLNKTCRKFLDFALEYYKAPVENCVNSEALL